MAPNDIVVNGEAKPLTEMVGVSGYISLILVDAWKLSRDDEGATQ